MNNDQKLLDRLAKQQLLLAQKVEIPISKRDFGNDYIIGATDVQYTESWGFAALIVIDKTGNQVNSYVRKFEAKTPYVPGFFAFREGEIIVKLITEAEQELDLQLDILLIDGHGIAHPRKFGVASFVGLLLERATIGIAKDTLLHYEGHLSPSKGSTLPIFLQNEEVGFALRSRQNIKPIFVSAGHLINNEQALEITKNLLGDYRQINALRQADHLARQAAKKS